MFRRRGRVVEILGGLILLLALAGCDWHAAKPLAIAVHPWAGYAPLFLARDEGWLDGRQVHLLETSSATDSMRALAEGRVDGAALTLDEVLKARARGLQLSIVMIFDVSAGADVLVARNGIETLADLKGRRIGFEQGAVGELMLAEILQAAGLDRTEVILLPLPADQQRAAWAENQLDAVVTYEPVASHLLQQGGRSLFDSRQIPDTIVDVLALRSELLDRRHALAIRHLLHAHFHAINHLHRNPQDAAYRMAPRLGLPAHSVLPIFKGLLLPDATENYRLLAGNTPGLLASARRLSTVMATNGLLLREDHLVGLISPDFLSPDFQ